MKKLFILILAVIITACGGSNKPNNTDSTKTDEMEINNPVKTEYQIISEEPNEALSKDNIRIRLNEKISETELKQIAEGLKSQRGKYNKLWIFYFLPDMKEDGTAWATTHYTPELEVQILGSTKEEDQNKPDLKIDGEVLGKWTCDQVMPGATYILFKNPKGKYIMKTVFNDGSSADKDLKKKKNRYDYENAFGEYYVVETNGTLGFYGKNGKFGVGTMTD